MVDQEAKRNQTLLAIAEMIRTTRDLVQEAQWIAEAAWATRSGGGAPAGKPA